MEYYTFLKHKLRRMQQFTSSSTAFTWRNFSACSQSSASLSLLSLPDLRIFFKCRKIYQNLHMKVASNQENVQTCHKQNVKSQLRYTNLARGTSIRVASRRSCNCTALFNLACKNMQLIQSTSHK